ncbi:hypothetical protein N9E66_05115 [Gammaproteobacteria bacterium]|nr:hypothetical protein [Gammaproteobacteria bacterium]
MNFNSKNFCDEYNISFNITIENVCQSNKLKSNSLCFNLNIDDDFVKSTAEYTNIVVFVPLKCEYQSLRDDILFLKVVNPRFSYIKASHDYATLRPTPDRHNVYISEESFVSDSATICPNVYIGPNCYISENSYIYPGANLIENVYIGKNSIIGSNTVIGSWGFGVERDNGKERSLYPHNGKAYKMPHFGGVHIDDDCDIGALNTIDSGAIEPTYISKNVQTDDHVHIAHNCYIGKGSCITACAEISGSVRIGDEVWVGPNSSIMQKIKIGDRSVIGLGSVVLRSVNEYEIVAGSPARVIKKSNDE